MPSTRRAVLAKSTPKLTPLQLHRKVGLLRAGVSGAEIARQLGKTRAAVNAVLLDRFRSREIEEAIADVLGEPVDQLFPSSAA